MKKIGLIGGISWISTADYYRYINLEINARLGDLNFAELIIYSVNYQQIVINNRHDDWVANYKIILDAARNLKCSGAEAIVICANTMHKLADQLEKEIRIPVINIATATAEAISKQGIKKAALLGTRFTMELDFFKDKLREKEIECLIPEAADRIFIHQTITEELARGIYLESSKKRYLEIIEKMIALGATGIILGCTEIPLLLKPEDIQVPSFDTTFIHSIAAVDFSLNK